MRAFLFGLAAAQLVVIEDGQPKTYYLSPNDEKTAPAPKISSDGRSFDMAYTTRAYLMATAGLPHSSSKKEDFKQLVLAGREINITVDLHGASCGCNAAFYGVSMPAMQPGEGGDWYCDANNVGGNACPEIDLIEANQNALHATPHVCKKPWTASSCDKAGLALVYGQGANDFGIGEKFTIDTTQPFSVSTSFAETAKYKVMTTTTSQKGKSVSKSVTTNVDGMWDDLAGGMVLTFSFWGSSTMSWLDGPPCKSDVPNCPAAVTFSDLSVGPAPPPAKGQVGCCSWDKVHCGAPGYCAATKDNCEGHCNGQWIPAPEDAEMIV